MKHKRLISIISLWVAALASGSAIAAKDNVFTWTDDKGVVHYGERPPKDSQARQIKTRTGHSDPTPNTTAPTSPTVSANATPDQLAASLKDPERCLTAQKNLELLNTAARIKIAGEDGVQRLLTEEEKEVQRNTMQTIIDQACE